ncbi:hypothetical protein J6590_090228 [Homalodisca vitripennis]|nr:hypothetical protein J6590_090228 [Homalodisca vitripennis]
MASEGEYVERFFAGGRAQLHKIVKYGRVELPLLPRLPDTDCSLPDLDLIAAHLKTALSPPGLSKNIFEQGTMSEPLEIATSFQLVFL